MFELFDDVSLNSATYWDLLEAGVLAEATMTFIIFPLCRGH